MYNLRKDIFSCTKCHPVIIISQKNAQKTNKIWIIFAADAFYLQSVVFFERTTNKIFQPNNFYRRVQYVYEIGCELSVFNSFSFQLVLAVTLINFDCVGSWNILLV